MITLEFTKLSKELQNTQEIAQDPELRRKFYYAFDEIFKYLSNKDWAEINLQEYHEPNDNAVFQNIAEGYYRLGFIEKPFFEYSKLVYELWYQKTLETQKRIGKRIHKGTQVHQIATIYELFNLLDKCWVYYFAGYIEDVLDGRLYSNSQAYRALRRIFGLSEPNLKVLSEKVSSLTENRFDPVFIFKMLQQEFTIPTFEENQDVDMIQLNTAKELWKQLIRLREEKMEKKENGS